MSAIPHIRRKRKDTPALALPLPIFPNMNLDLFHDPVKIVQGAASLVRSRWNGITPDVCVIAGSGFRSLQELGSVVDSIAIATLPNMPVPTVHGHGANAMLINTDNRSVMLFTGRVHLYEGLGAVACLLYPALAFAIGVRRFIFTHAVGGLHPLIQQGSIILPYAGLNLTNAGIPTITSHGRSPSMPDPAWIANTAAGCLQAGISTHGGTVAQVVGPSYETRAEIRMLRRIGASAVGMSSIAEARWITALGARSLVASFVSNVASDVSASSLLHSHVVEAAADATDLINTVVTSAIQNTP